MAEPGGTRRPIVQRPPGFSVGEWVPLARRSWRRDAVAGLTLWGLILPESIAYAGLAGLPATSGVWAIILILPFYALWGHSRHLVATPASAASVTMGGIISQVEGADPVHVAAGISLTAGLWYLVIYLFRLGFFVNFISTPINAGFMFGLAIFITVAQLPKLFGVEGVEGNAIERSLHLVEELPRTNWVTLLLGLVGFAVLIGLPRLRRGAPAGLVMIALLGLAVALLSLDSAYGVHTSEVIPREFPGFVTPQIPLQDWGLVIAGALGLVLLDFGEASSMARGVAEQKGYHYQPERDLWAFGAANLASGSIGGLIGAGSMSSTSTNVAAGARTQLSTLVAAAAALVTVLTFGDAFANLPEVALAVLIIHAVTKHINLRAIRLIARFSPGEVVIAWIAAGGVLIFDVLWGLLIAVTFSILWFVRQSTSLEVFELGRSPSLSTLLVRDRVEGFEPLPEGVLALRFSGALFYANVNSAVEIIEERRQQQRATLVIVDLSGQSFFDYTTAAQLRKYVDTLGAQGADLALVGVRDRLEDSLRAAGAFPDGLTVQRSTDVASLLEGRSPGPPATP